MNPLVPPYLRWACRRGMLELDILLGCFLEEAFPKLSLKEQTGFIQLLDHNDQDLFVWLTGKELPPDPAVATVVAQVRYHAQSRH
jgi:antitoxin CptB